MTRMLPPTLDRASTQVAPALRAAVGVLEPGMAGVIGYHLGWVDAQGEPAELAGGKSVRATLALLSAQAAGAPQQGLPGATAVELVHAFSLLHDDIMDADEERHHRPAAWTVFGPDRAILAGDAALALAFRVLLDAPSSHRAAACESLVTATGRLIDGQARDLGLEGRVDATPEEVSRMCAGKTGALLACAASIGAVLAGAGSDVTEPLAAFGEHVGLAFQAVDDMLGIWGDPALTGKPVYRDLARRKSSLPVAIALQAGGEDAARLAGLLGRPKLDPSGLEAAAALVEACGGRAGASDRAARELDLALAVLDAAPIDAGARADLADVARFVVTREF
jgi:geranylgeranyl diphosphate synthase type I